MCDYALTAVAIRKCCCCCCCWCAMAIDDVLIFTIVGGIIELLVAGVDVDVGKQLLKAFCNSNWKLASLIDIHCIGGNGNISAGGGSWYLLPPNGFGTATSLKLGNNDVDTFNDVGDFVGELFKLLRIPLLFDLDGLNIDVDCELRILGEYLLLCVYPLLLLLLL